MGTRACLRISRDSRSATGLSSVAVITNWALSFRSASALLSNLLDIKESEIRMEEQGCI